MQQAFLRIFKIFFICAFLLMFFSCGKHDHFSTSENGIQDVTKIQNEDVLSQFVIDEDVDAIKAFIANGGKPEVMLKNKRTVMTEACFWEKYKIIDVLKKANADITFKDDLGKSPEDYALENKKLKNILFPEALSEERKKIYSIIKLFNVNGTKKLLQENPDLNFLLDSTELNIDLGEYDGESILTFIVLNKQENLLRLILQPKYLVDLNLPNRRNQTPLEIARRLNYTNIEKMLLKLGARDVR